VSGSNREALQQAYEGRRREWTGARAAEIEVFVAEAAEQLKAVGVDPTDPRAVAEYRRAREGLPQRALALGVAR